MRKSLSLSLSLSLSSFLWVLLLCTPCGAQNNQPAPVSVKNGSNTVLTLTTNGGISAQSGITTGNGMINPGQLTLFGVGGNTGSLQFLAPNAFTNNTNVVWALPSTVIPSSGAILLLISPTGAMSYATVVGQNGITVSQPAGSLAFSLGSSLNLGGFMPTLNDSAGGTIVALNSTGLGGNYLRISNDSGGSNPAGPLISAAGPGTAIPLQLSDVAGAGVDIESNGGLAMKVTSATPSPANYFSVTQDPPASLRAAAVLGLRRPTR